LTSVPSEGCSSQQRFAISAARVTRLPTQRPTPMRGLRGCALANGNRNRPVGPRASPNRRPPGSSRPTRRRYPARTFASRPGSTSPVASTMPFSV
jgi:hypothetical protein